MEDFEAAQPSVTAASSGIPVMAVAPMVAANVPVPADAATGTTIPESSAERFLRAHGCQTIEVAVELCKDHLKHIRGYLIGNDLQGEFLAQFYHELELKVSDHAELAELPISTRVDRYKTDVLDKMDNIDDNIRAIFVDEYTQWLSGMEEELNGGEGQ